MEKHLLQLGLRRDSDSECSTSHSTINHRQWLRSEFCASDHRDVVAGVSIGCRGESEGDRERFTPREDGQRKRSVAVVGSPVHRYRHRGLVVDVRVRFTMYDQIAGPK